MSFHNLGRFAPGGIQSSYSYIPGYGKLDGVITATQMPVIVIEQVFFRAKLTNTDTIYIGTDNAVTADNGIPLNPGEFSPWLPVKSLDLLWYICENAGDDLVYFIVR